VNLEDPFICPHCGGSLAPPALDSIRPRRRTAVLAVLFACVAIGAGATVLARGRLFERPARQPAPTLATLEPAALPGPTVFFTVDTLAAPAPADIEAEESEPPSRAGRRALSKSVHKGERREAALPAASGHHHANVHLAVSIPLVAGGQPEYPEQYQEDGRSGSVTVACALQPDGGPTQCRTTQLTGGRIFDVSVHSWLDLRDVRFKPVQTRHHRPAHDVKLKVDFIGDGPAPQ
jgi:TonB family protein